MRAPHEGVTWRAPTGRRTAPDDLSRRIGREAAEDVSAETFLVAFQQRAGFITDGRDCLPWLYGIATRGATARGPRRLRPLIAAGVALAVAAGVIIGIAVSRLQGPGQVSHQVIAWSGRPAAPWVTTGRSYGKASSATQLLDFAARAAAEVPDHAPRPDQWIAFKTETAESSAGNGGFLFGPPTSA